MFKPPPLGTPDVTGDLQRFPIPRMLFFLLKKAFLGTISITSPSLTGHIYLRDGMPVFTDIPSTRDVLGRVLLERGVIDEQTYNSSLQELAQTGELHGQILLRARAITERTLVEGLRLQLHRKLNRLFTLAEAQVALFAGEHGVGRKGEAALVQADPLRVIYHGVRNCFDMDRMSPELDKLHGHVVRLRPGFERRQARYGMSEEEAALASFLAEQALSVEDLLRTSHLSPLQTLMIIYTLWVTEALSSSAVSARASRPPSAPMQPATPHGAPRAMPTRPRPVTPPSPVAPVSAPISSVPAEPPPSMSPVDMPSGVLPRVEDLARSFSTDLLQSVGGHPGSGEIRPIELGDDAPLITPPPPGAVITPPPPEALITPPPPEALITPPPPEALITPPPSSDVEPIPVTAPLITPPPPDELSMPLITPPPFDPTPEPLITPIPLVTPPPEDSAPATPVITPPPPSLASIVLGDEAGDLPPAAPANEPRAFSPRPLPTMPTSSPPGSASVAPEIAGRGRRPSSQQSGTFSGFKAVAEYKALLRKTQDRMKEQNHFQVLEVTHEATVDQVRDAYFRLAKIYHPDRCAALGLLDMSSIAEEIFRRINDAHSVLTDPEARKAYEAELDGSSGKKEALEAMEAEFAFQKGVILFRKKNFTEALRCFQEAWQLNSKEGEHLAWIAWTQFNDPKQDTQKTLPQIKEQLLRAIKISPQNALCHYYLGEIYLALGDDKRARTCFTRTVELQDNHVEATRHLRLMQMRREKAEKKDKGLFGGLLKKK